MTEKQEIQLLLECVRTVRSQIQSGQAPDLSRPWRAAGLTEEQTNDLANRWAEMVQAILAAEPTEDAVLLERTDNIRVGSLRLLFAILVPDYRERVMPEPIDSVSQRPENEHRSAITLTREELHTLLRTTLIDAAFPPTE